MRHFRYLSFVWLFICGQTFAETFFVQRDQIDVILGPVCVPELAGEEAYASLDFNTSGLIITVGYHDNGSYVTYNYTQAGATIDDGPGTGAHGDPATNNIEVDAIATGALAGCVYLHFNDEVFSVTDTLSWTIEISDGGTLIMDHTVVALAVSGSADIQSDVTASLNSYDPPTNTEMNARTLVAANYGTAANQTTIISDIGTTDAAVDNLTADIGTNGNGLTAIPAMHILNGTATGGSATTVADTTNLTQATDYWNNYYAVILLSGTASPHVGCIRDFNATTDTLTFTPAAGAAVASSDTYMIVPMPGCAGIYP